MKHHKTIAERIVAALKQFAETLRAYRADDEAEYTWTKKNYLARKAAKEYSEKVEE